MKILLNYIIILNIFSHTEEGRSDVLKNIFNSFQTSYIQ